MNKLISLIIISILLFINFGTSIISGNNESNYNLVIISPEKYYSNLEILVEHKNSVGINTLVKNVEDIYHEYSGGDNAEKIKYFIKIL